MNDLFVLYGWTFAAAALLAPALAFIGIHLAARDRAMKTVCMGQGAALGVVLGFGASHVFLHGHQGESVPWGAALLGAVASYLIGEKMVSARAASRNTSLTLLFTLLLAMSYLASSLMPGLETHLTQAYFGDLATLVRRDAFWAMGLSAIALTILVSRANAISALSFEIAVFGERHAPKYRGAWRDPFHWVAVLLVAFSVQFAGFLFTLGMLFIPTGILAYAKTGQTTHFVSSVSVATVGAVLGLFISLQAGHLPTVPTIVCVSALLALGVLLVLKVKGDSR